MKLLVVLTLFSQLAFAATPAEWNDCVQSFQGAKTIRFGVQSVGRAPNSTLTFNKGFPYHEEVSIFHKGAFWFASLGEQRSGTVRANLGNDSFCFKYKIKLVFTDKLELTPYNNRCKESSVVNFSQNSTHDSVADLAKKLQKDIERGQFCFSDITVQHAFSCDPDAKKEAFAKLKSWNTAACKKLENPGINQMIQLNELVLREYPRQRDAAPPAAPGQAPQLNHVTN